MDRIWCPWKWQYKMDMVNKRWLHRELASEVTTVQASNGNQALVSTAVSIVTVMIAGEH